MICIGSGVLTERVMAVLATLIERTASAFDHESPRRVTIRGARLFVTISHESFP